MVHRSIFTYDLTINLARLAVPLVRAGAGLLLCKAVADKSSHSHQEENGKAEFLLKRCHLRDVYNAYIQISKIQF